MIFAFFAQSRRFFIRRYRTDCTELTIFCRARGRAEGNIKHTLRATAAVHCVRRDDIAEPVNMLRLYTVAVFAVQFSSLAVLICSTDNGAVVIASIFPLHEIERLIVVLPSNTDCSVHGELSMPSFLHDKGQEVFYLSFSIA